VADHCAVLVNPIGTYIRSNTSRIISANLKESRRLAQNCLSVFSNATFASSATAGLPFACEGCAWILTLPADQNDSGDPYP